MRRMFEAYATGGYTFDELHELVVGWGLTSHREKPIARSMLPQLLANPFYIGLFRFAGETHEGSHQPIVSKALFDEVQNVMARRGRPHKPRRKPLPYLGFIQCGECGAAITGERQKGHHYYRCTRKLGPCSQKRFIREEALTDELRAVTARVRRSRQSPEPTCSPRSGSGGRRNPTAALRNWPERTDETRQGRISPFPASRRVP